MIRLLGTAGLVLCAGAAFADIVPKPHVLRARMAKAIVAAGHECPSVVSVQFTSDPRYQTLRQDGYKVYIVDCASSGWFVVATPRVTSEGRRTVVRPID